MPRFLIGPRDRFVTCDALYATRFGKGRDQLYGALPSGAGYLFLVVRGTLQEYTTNFSQFYVYARKIPEIEGAQLSQIDRKIADLEATLMAMKQERRDFLERIVDNLPAITTRDLPKRGA